MSNPIQEKATEWWQLISGEETAEAYKNFFKLTWKILKETVLLLWLLLCFVLVAIGWVWNNSSKVTESVSELRGRASQNENGNLMADAAVKLWEASQTGASNAVAKARKRLDLPEIENTAQKKTPVAPPKEEEVKAADNAEVKVVLESQEPSSPPLSEPDAQASSEPNDEGGSPEPEHRPDGSSSISEGEIANPAAAVEKASQDAGNIAGGG